MRLSCRLFAGILAAVILGCAGWGLLPRWRLEREDRDVAIVADFRDIVPLALGAGVSVDGALALLKEKGLRGLMVGELTGEDAASGVGPVAAAAVRGAGGVAALTRLSVEDGFPQADRAGEWLRLKAVGEAAEGGDVLLPVPLVTLRTVGILPDISGLEAGVRSGLPLYYRPAPSLGWQTKGAAELLGRVLDAYPIAAVTPSGESVSGYPDVGPIAAEPKGRGVPVAAVEFSRQLGAVQLNNLSFPSLLTLHSVTNEELVARSIGRQALLERLVRAAAERSVRLLVLRSAPSGHSASTLDAYAGEVASLAERLRGHGFRMEWPHVLFSGGEWRSGFLSFLSAYALVAAFLFALWRYVLRLLGDEEVGEAVGMAAIAAFFLLAGGGAFLIRSVPAAGRLLGALAAPLVVTEASLTAMSSGRTRTYSQFYPWGPILCGFFTAVVGGLALAAFFSDPLHMLRLRTFSGVKLTLLLPPILVLLHDLKNRVHPESLNAFLSRPPLWGELMLGGVLLVLLGIVLFRSDNVRFIPGFEARVRGALEQWLVARPRSKEVFLGYPSLMLLAFAVKNSLWARYRELFRLGAALGFSSVVNSFCHFHTPLAFILRRELNGLWLGLLFGSVVVLAVGWILLPLWRRLRVLAE
ncbi:DUF5693 family protein [uncultured Fretibacterium sp.]|uniref:DUF5693 family protein n=1 Tax=uncultured Fretibacterium sp. TaxID=1678694 RepID=UPI002604CF06|nr:DUF5693 family protein [uncultured Fretibacterium sp.]